MTEENNIQQTIQQEQETGEEKKENPTLTNTTDVENNTKQPETLQFTDDAVPLQPKGSENIIENDENNQVNIKSTTNENSNQQAESTSNQTVTNHDNIHASSLTSTTPLIHPSTSPQPSVHATSTRLSLSEDQIAVSERRKLFIGGLKHEVTNGKLNKQIKSNKSITGLNNTSDMQCFKTTFWFSCFVLS